MDEKTEELRDLFVDVSGEETVTESQEDARGSLATDEEGVEDRLAEVVDRMRDRFDFETDLSEGALVTVVRSFYDGDDDETIAGRIDSDAAAVFEARQDLHLFRDGDTDLPVDPDAVRERREDAVESIADDLGVDPETARRARHAVLVRDRARRASHRFQSEFEDALAEAGLSETMTESVRQDGLEEATEDIGSLEDDADVDF